MSYQRLKNNDLRDVFFDTPGASHYHTAPMPTALDQPLNAFGLAAAGAVVERQFPIARFARLVDRLAEPSGTAQLRLALMLVDDVPVGELELRASVLLICQRCLRSMRRELVSQSHVAFVPRDDSEAPGDYEAIPGDPRRVDLAAVAEDELLLSLPLIAQHAPKEECRLPAEVEAAVAESKPEAPAMRRPFAGLKDLLKH
jgi:hypothetical protein